MILAFVVGNRKKVDWVILKTKILSKKLSGYKGTEAEFGTLQLASFERGPPTTGKWSMISRKCFLQREGLGDR